MLYTVSEVVQLVELLQWRKVYLDNGVETVRHPSELLDCNWFRRTSGCPSSPQLSNGLDGTLITQTMGVPTVWSI